MAEADASIHQYCAPPPFSVEAQGHKLTFFPSGTERIAALIRVIDEAQERLCIIFYVFATDQAGTRVRDALAAAARRGVEVRVVVDGFGALADNKFFAPVIEAGGAFCRFVPRWSRRYLIRNHQKLVVADGKVAMLGGSNVEDDYFAPPEEDGWNDLTFTVEGPVVERAEAWFDELEAWTRQAKSQFRAIRRKVRKWECGEGPVQLLIGGPTRGLSSWAREVSRDLVEGERLDMITAYFSPSPRLLKRIRRIASKGKANLLLPAKSDNGATVGAARALYTKLLRAGARIWEFQPCKLHTKLIVLDDTSYLGSANFDMRSLYLNLEIMLKIEDAGLAERLREYVQSHFPASEEITREVHASRATWLNRLRWRASLFLVSVVDYTVSRRLNLGQ